MPFSSIRADHTAVCWKVNVQKPYKSIDQPGSRWYFCNALVSPWLNWLTHNEDIHFSQFSSWNSLPAPSLPVFWINVLEVHFKTPGQRTSEYSNKPKCSDHVQSQPSCLGGHRWTCDREMWAAGRPTICAIQIGLEGELLLLTGDTLSSTALQFDWLLYSTWIIHIVLHLI